MIYDQFLHYERQTDNQLYACCPFHAEKTPSFTVNEETGEWYCHGECQVGGSEKEFIAKYYDVSLQVAKAAVAQYEANGTLPFPTEEQIEQYHQELLKHKTDLEEMYAYGWTPEIVDELKLGFDGHRIGIPVKSRTGCWVNIRWYLPAHRRTPGKNAIKCINAKKLGQKRYYPYQAFDGQEIFIVEGEKDCIAARAQGLNAVTSTGGSAIPTEEIWLFKDKDVVLMLDTDSVGKRNEKTYISLLRNIARSIRVVELPVKDFADYFKETHDSDVLQFAQDLVELQQAEQNVEVQDVSLVRSEFSEHFNTWLKLNNMSVVGVEPKIYTIPTKIRATCRNATCSKPCPLAFQNEPQTIDIEPRQILQFLDSSDTAQDSLARKLYGCKSVITEPVEYTNVQKIIFQESASFIDGLEESSFESRYGIYMYNDFRLNATLKYNFEACRVTDPRSQQNYYMIRSAENLAMLRPVVDVSSFEKFRQVATSCGSMHELIDKHYQEWMPALAIEGRPDLFGALMLTYCSVTEIPWQAGLIKGWLDTMVIGDTRTGKSQMAQRLVKVLGMGGYINGENARRTGVIGGVQRFGDSWVITWGAIPMNDRGLLIIDEASGLEVDDIKDLSSTRSSGAVTLNKIVKGEARARTRLIWLSNPRSGRNLSDFYWKGYGAFQEFIPVAEDQARFDLVLTAAREDIDVLDGIDAETQPELSKWLDLINAAWAVTSEDIIFPPNFKTKVREVAHKLNDDYGGGPLVVGVAVHEKLLRLCCATAVLCGEFYDGKLRISEKHLEWADEFLRWTLEKESFSYASYIREFKRAQSKKAENIQFIRGLLSVHPALRVLLSSSSFKGFQFQEILGIDRTDSAKILSDLITRGLMRPVSNATYVPDKLLMEIAKQMEQ
jgi:5S rRNA maturation endonuclease (ribonuclease M5)